MQKGDIVMANHPENRSRALVRSYGIVQEITEAGVVIIEMADGSLISRQFNSVAVYIQPPSNWSELFKQQRVVLSRPKQQMMARGSSINKRHN